MKLKIARIDHDRCYELSAVTYVWVPEDWTNDNLKAVVKAAQKAYLEFLESWKDENPPNNATSYSQPRYKDFPDKTVAEVDAIHKAEREEYKAWSEKRTQAKKSFGWYLEQEGCRQFWGYVPEMHATVDWGHRHGTPIDYDETEDRDFPAPLVLEDDEDYFAL